jgi:hypothetical protein
LSAIAFAALAVDLRLDNIADAQLAGLEHADVRKRRADFCVSRTAKRADSQRSERPESPIWPPLSA